jgi:hypothetical protein
MEEFRLGDQVVRYDRDATVAATSRFHRAVQIVAGASTAAISLLIEVTCIRRIFERFSIN